MPGVRKNQSVIWHGPLTAEEQEQVLALWSVAESVARKVAKGGPWEEDLRQEAFYGLIRAVRSWQPGGASLRNFAWRCAWSAVMDHVVAQVGKKRRNTVPAVSLDATVAHHGGDPIALAQLVPDPRAARDLDHRLAQMDVEWYARRLPSPGTREAFRHHAQGLNQGEIARIMGVSQSHVCYLLQAASEHMTGRRGALGRNFKGPPLPQAV